jgi:hypothetical protein
LEFYHSFSEWEPTELEKDLTSLQDSPELRKTQRAFIKASREAQFLFDDDSGIHQLLERTHTAAMWVIGYKRTTERALRGLPQERLLSDFSEQMKVINASIPSLDKRLSKYLDFHTLTAWTVRNP